MRILWVVPFQFWTADSGGKIRVYNLVRRMAARGHEVAVWCIHDDSPLPQTPEIPGVSWHLFRQLPRRSIASKIAAMLSPFPTAAWALRSPGVLSMFEGALSFDAVVVEQSTCGALIPELEAHGLRWVLDAHNVEWWLTSQISRSLKNPLTRLRFALDATKFKHLERRLLRTARSVIAVSAQDADRLRALWPSATIDLCPNGVDADHFGFVDHSEPAGGHMLMTGTLGYYPNLDASLWLVKEILPKVRARIPNAAVTLVGSAATQQLRRFDDPDAGVQVVGWVPDVRPHMAAADVFVIPLRLGSGTRLKALEAMASGLPIVSTRLGVEGLGLIERDLVLLGETSEELAAGVERALTDGPLRSRLVTEGRRYVVECFEWDRIAGEIDVILERVVK